jgi:ComF family protein
MILTKNLQLLSDAFLTIVYPHPCVICQQSVERRELGVACENCWSNTHLFAEDDALCWKCGNVSFAPIDPNKRRDIHCRRCDDYMFDAARACGLYEKALRETVLNLKRQPYVPERISGLLKIVAQREPLKESTLIIPVPLHPDREKARGFNQASVISKVLSKSLNLPVNEVSLIRTSHTEKYRAGLDAKGRTDTVAHAFEIVHPRLIAGEKILLLDDVLTTGATAAACSDVLKDAGAERVNVLTIARTAR